MCYTFIVESVEQKKRDKLRTNAALLLDTDSNPNALLANLESHDVAGRMKEANDDVVSFGF